MGTFNNFVAKPWLYLVVVLIGTALKFYQLNSKLFWMDEISSVLYTSGLKEDVVTNAIPVNKIEKVKYYDDLLHISTKPSTLKNEVTSIFSEVHLTPLHYVILTFWCRLAGDSNTAYRLFSVFVFLISLPLMFLLAKTMFKSGLAGWIAVSLYAVSPMVNFEAQEARYYSLWVLFFILTNYLFLQAIIKNKILWWLFYTLAAILALYTSSLSGLFLLGHLIYVLLFAKKVRTEVFLSLFVVFLAYLPWMIFLYSARENIRNGLSWHIDNHHSFFTLELLLYQLLGFARSFIYLYDATPYSMFFNAGITSPQLYYTLCIDVLTIAFLFFAVFYLIKKAPTETSWYLLLIIFPLFLLLYISDIVRHGFTTLIWRYQIVNLVGVSLVITWLLYSKIAKGKTLYAGVYLMLIFSGIASIIKIENNNCWNTRPDCESNVETAQIISAAAHPLLITDFNSSGLPNFLAVVNKAGAKNMDVIYCKGAIPDLKKEIAGKNYSDIYVLHASDELAQKISLQFGQDMKADRKGVWMFYPQIWQIKL